MKKILLVAAVLLLAAGCGKTVSKQNENQQAQGGGQQSPKELMALNKPQKCEVSFRQDDATQTQGVIYIGNGKMRSEYSMAVGGKTLKPRTILDGNTMYSWNEGDAQGFKFNSQTSQQTGSGSGQSQGKANAADLDKKMDVKCSSWSVDNSVFNLPSNVKFASLEDMMPNIPAPGPNSNASACSACGNLPASAKAQCLSALNCK